MDSRTVWLARTAMWATIWMFLVMFVAFVFIQPELNPLHRFGSEYAVGRMGWLMKLNFFVWGTGLAALGLAMAYGLDPDAKSRVAIVLFILAGAGIFLSGIFDTDLQVLNENPPPKWIEGPASDEHKLHVVVGIIAFFSLFAGAGLATRRLRIANRLHGKYRFLRPLSWLLPIVFFVALFTFQSLGLVGLGQRIALVFIFAWVLLAARGLEKGAFLTSDAGHRQ